MRASRVEIVKSTLDLLSLRSRKSQAFRPKEFQSMTILKKLFQMMSSRMSLILFQTPRNHHSDTLFELDLDKKLGGLGMDGL